MSVAYWSTCRSTIGQPLSVGILTDISVECQSTYWPMLDRYVGRYIERHISVDITTDARPICRPKYRSTLGQYVDRCVGWLLVDMSTDMSVEGRGVQKIHMIQKDSHSAKACTVPNFLFQQKTSRYPSFLLLQTSYLLICYTGTLKRSPP